MNPLDLRRIPLVAALLLALPLLACTDNATKLTSGIERALHRTGDAPAGTTLTIPYRPERRPGEPYTLVFFPSRRVTPHDLVQAGLSRPVTDEIFGRLDYLDVGGHEMLVVVQEGVRLNFTTSFRRFASVEELLVLRGVGTRQLLLERKDGTWMIRGWADDGLHTEPQ